ncbi:MAG: redoxin domain-containing protein [Candidatus Manganitrophaceae bacterium]
MGGRIRSLYWKISLRVGWFFRRRRREGATVGSRLPDFTLRDLSGRPFTLSEVFPGRGAVLWFTNLCEGCEERINFLQRIYETNRNRLEIVALSTLGNDRATPERIVRTHRIDFPLLLDPDDWLGRVLRFEHPGNACPLYNLLILDSTGVVRFRSHLSAIGDEAFLKALGSIVLRISLNKEKTDAA